MELENVSGLPPEVTAYILQLEPQVKTQQRQIEQLTETVAKLQKIMYGQRKYVLGEDPDQLCLFNEAELEAKSHAPEPTRLSVAGCTWKPKRTKEELAAELPVEEIVCELDQETLACRECGGSMRPLGKETVREEIEFIPAQVKLLRYIRYSYVCENCEKETGEASIIKAPTPPPVIKRSLASPSTVAHVSIKNMSTGCPCTGKKRIGPTREWIYPVLPWPTG